MPGKSRVYLPNISCHIIQRGNSREMCFFAEQDYQFYRECLFEATKYYGVSLHAYVLMTNYVHLLMTPDSKTGISQVM